MSVRRDVAIVAAAAIVLALAVAAFAFWAPQDTPVATGGAENGKPCPPEPAPPDDPNGAPFDGGLEQLVQDEAAALGDRFAGSSLQSDGTVIFRITGGDVSDRLRDHAKVRVVRMRFSTDELDEVMDDVADRLNALLAPGIEPGTPGRWPWKGEVDVDENAVLLQVDPAHQGKDPAICGVLGKHLRSGAARYCYAPVPATRLL